MTPLASAEGHWVLASHGDQLAQIVRRWDVTPDRLVAGLGLTEAALQDPVGHVSVATYVALIERARALTGEPGLGFYLGLQKCATVYGFLGFAAMAASSLPLVQANRAAAQLAREQCEHALEALGYQRDADIERVRELLRSDGGYRSLEKVAKALAVSSRTLKRKLASEGVSFSTLVAEERQKKAMSLLDRRQIPLEEIAARTGYSSLSNFVRAFRDWTGTTPAEYRRSRTASRALPSRE